ncbi:MAG: FemAB family XrtA/PEP-CTERM system-associated protein [Candidatus Thiodiazotropha sp.]
MSEAYLIPHTTEHRRDWNHYLNEADGSNFYQRFEWQELNETHFGHKTFSIAVGADKIEGILPLVLVRSRLFGKILCSMPFVNYGGTCFDSEEHERALLGKAMQLADQHGVDYLEMRSTRPSILDLPESTRKVSMTIPLDADSEKIWSGFKSKHRTNIRRVYKHDIQVKSGHAELLDDFYRVISHSWRDLGTPLYSKNYFKAILDHFPQEEIKIFVAYLGDQPICTAFNGYYKRTVEGMWMGTVQQYRQLQPTYVLYWEMIKDSCDMGCLNYHLGRSTVDSTAEAFKKKWNAEQKQLYWQYYMPDGGAMPELNVDNAKYKLAIDMWRRLPLPVAGLLGPWISRSIP